MLNYQVVSEQLSDLKKKQDSILKKKPANTDSDLKKKESDLKKKQAAIESELKKKQAAMESELKELRAECAKVGNDSTEYKSKYENARNTLERAKKVLALLRTENEKLFHENEAQRALREKADRENNELREEVREIREMLTASKESIVNVISRLQPLEPLVSAVQPDDQLRQSTSSTETPAAETKKLDEKVVKKRELSVTDENCNR